MLTFASISCFTSPLDLMASDEQTCFIGDERKSEGFFHVLFLLMPLSYWPIPPFPPPSNMIHGDDVALSPGCMWRTWTRSRGQRAPVFVMTSSSALSFHSDSEKDEKKTPKKSCRNNDARPPPPAPPPPLPPLFLPNPAKRYFILGSACKAPLKVCKSELLLPRGCWWEPAA